MSRIILHVDMDSFFCSIEVRDNPSLRGRPVIVGADPKGGKGRGVVSTCSYAARKLGIHSAMPISQAYKISPDAKYIPVNMYYYTRVSESLMHILRRFSLKFQQVSIDEAFLDVTDIVQDYGLARQLAMKIKQDLFLAEKMTCSIGIGPNKQIAKIASDLNKPNGLTVVEPDHVNEFLRPLKVGKINGIGKKTQERLAGLGIKTVGDLADYDKDRLMEALGNWGAWLHLAAHGIDCSEVREEEGIRSVSREITFQTDVDDRGMIFSSLEDIAESVHEALFQEGLSYRTVSIKVRFEDFETHTRARTVVFPTTDKATIHEISKELLEEFLESRKKIRLIGVRLSSLEQPDEIQRSIKDFFV